MLASVSTPSHSNSSFSLSLWLRHQVLNGSVMTLVVCGLYFDVPHGVLTINDNRSITRVDISTHIYKSSQCVVVVSLSLLLLLPSFDSILIWTWFCWFGFCNFVVFVYFSIVAKLVILQTCLCVLCPSPLLRQHFRTLELLTILAGVSVSVPRTISLASM